MISLALNMLSWTKVHLPSQHLAKKLQHLAGKIMFCEIDKEAVSLVDRRLQLSEETYCKILSDCRREHDIAFDEIELNHEITPDSEEETDVTGLTTIWSRRRSVRPPRRTEDFF